MHDHLYRSHINLQNGVHVFAYFLDLQRDAGTSTKLVYDPFFAVKYARLLDLWDQLKRKRRIDTVPRLKFYLVVP